MFRKLSVAVILFLFCATLYSQDVSPRKNTLKTTFLSFYTGSAKLTYERAIFSNQSIEVTGGVIGVAFDAKHNEPSGSLFRYAHKFIFSGHSQYPLNGMYVKPEFALSNFHYNNAMENTQRDKSTMGALMGCFGYQWAKRRLVLDGFVGAGGALGKACDTHYQHGFILWGLSDAHSKHIALTFGAKVGIAL